MARRTPRSFRPALEGLEERLALSVVAASLSNGTLTLSCNNRTTQAGVSRSGRHIFASDRTNQFLRRFPAAQVKRVQFIGGNGNDCFVNNVPGLPATAVGKRGSDVLAGNTAADVLRGGPGNDVLYGRMGNDRIWGDDNNDRIYADTGTTHLYGGKHDDYIINFGGGTSNQYGGPGDDTLIGGTGKDQLHGGDNDDWLFGGDENDSLEGDDGDDYLFGEDGDDVLAGGNDNDWLEAGSAEESADGGDGIDWNAHIWAYGGTLIDDVLQAPYTDTCAFLASLAACAASGARFEDSIVYLGDFRYRLAFGDGSFQEVEFDGTLTGRDPRFAVEGESWTILYQRAWLDRAGSGYAETGVALTALSGAQARIRAGEPRVEDFGFIRDQLASRRPVVVGTPVVPADEFSTIAENLRHDHDYTVTAVEWSLADGSPLSVTLRDPEGAYIVLSWEEFRSSIDSIALA